MERALEMTGLTDLRQASMLTLSGGETQRAFLAQVFAQDPRVLILDEPANHLDLNYQQQIFSLIQAWLRQPGRAVLSVVHDLSLARRYGTHAVLMHRGMIWGAAFAAQRAGMDHVGPFTFSGVRMLLAGLVLTPAALLFGEKKPERPDPRTQRRAGGMCGLFLCAATLLQQAGLVDTGAGKAGFITALYVVLVPVWRGGCCSAGSRGRRSGWGWPWRCSPCSCSAFPPRIPAGGRGPDADRLRHLLHGTDPLRGLFRAEGGWDPAGPG